jgi:single-stranded-DNA-specific exonuclease
MPKLGGSRHTIPPASALGTAGIPAVVAQLLIARDLRRRVPAVLDPKLTGLRDPELLPGAPAAAKLLYEAARAKRRITVYGDYDADGMTATAILWRCLRLLDANVDFYVPHRIDEGYGLNDDALRKLAEQGADVVVTVDCGIASLGEADLAVQLGLTLMVTDHHQMAEVHGVPTLPAASSTGPPGGGYRRPVRRRRRPRSPGPFQLACRTNASPNARQFLLQAVGLAAIGTVADVVADRGASSSATA